MNNSLDSTNRALKTK
jgi:hypothetical protein